MNLYVDPKQGHDDSMISLVTVTEAARDFSPGPAKGGLPDDSSHHLHIHAHLFSEKKHPSQNPTAFMVDLR